MTARITETIEVKNFLNTATTFCNLVRRPNSVDIATFLAKMEILLPALCTFVKFLPQIERSPDYSGKWSHKTWQKLYKKLQNYLGKYDSFCHVYEPYNSDDNEPTIGSLSDDLVDIYGDLSSGLTDWNRAQNEVRRATIDDWQRSYRLHWGYHAISAQWAIIWLIHHYNVGTEDETFKGYRTKK